MHVNQAELLYCPDYWMFLQFIIFFALIFKRRAQNKSNQKTIHERTWNIRFNSVWVARLRRVHLSSSLVFASSQFKSQTTCLCMLLQSLINQYLQVHDEGMLMVILSWQVLVLRIGCCFPMLQLPDLQGSAFA